MDDIYYDEAGSREEALDFCRELAGSSVGKKAILITKTDVSSDLVALCSETGIALTVMSNLEAIPESWQCVDKIESDSVKAMAFEEMLWIPDSGALYFRGRQITGFKKTEQPLFGAMKGYLKNFFRHFDEKKAASIVS